MFFILNKSSLSASWSEYFISALYGVRFDLSAIFSVNILYLVLRTLPIKFLQGTIALKILRVWFIITNTVMFLFEISDIGYFPYVRKRMTKEVFNLIGNQSDFLQLLPSYLLKFWWISLLISILIVLIIYISRMGFAKKDEYRLKFSIPNFSIWLFAILVAIIAIRGGLQLKPIVNSTALLYAKPIHTPLVLNTTFNILHSFEQKELYKLHYFEDDELSRSIQITKNYAENKAFAKKNVVVIILESFGKKYMGIGHRKSFTPFLDSLASIGFNAERCFANAYTSVDGIPAVLAGIPRFMNEPFVYSSYAGNSFNSMANMLGPLGYSTSFFHGGERGSMNFDVFAKSAGFQKHFSRQDYPNQNDYDGTWGIYDGPFLQYMAQKLNEEKQPFASAVFTLSSHEPFSLPANFNNTYIQSLKGMERGVSYTDLALRDFFQTASKQAWFSNTLFVITADHNFLMCNDPLGYYNHGVGLYSIPLLFYCPSDATLKGTSQELTQQMDVLPSIMHYLHYPNSFKCFGKSLWDSSSAPQWIAKLDNSIYYMRRNIVYTGADTTLTGIYDYNTDSLLKHNLSNQDSLRNAINTHYKMYLQWLTNSMIDNKLK